MLISKRNSRKFVFLIRAAQSFLSIMTVVALFIGIIPRHIMQSEKMEANTGTVVTDRQSLVCCVPI